MIEGLMNVLLKLLEYLQSKRVKGDHLCISCGHVYVCTRERCPMIESLVCNTCEDYYRDIKIQRDRTRLLAETARDSSD